LKDSIAANREGTATLDQQLQVLLARQERYTGATRNQKAALQAEIDSIRAQIAARDTALARRDAEIESREKENEVIEETVALVEEETEVRNLAAEQFLAAQAAQNEIAREAYERELERREDLAEYNIRLRDEKDAQLEQARLDAEEEMRLRKEVASFTLSLAQQTTGNIVALFEEGSRARKAALIVDSIAERSSGAFNAFIATQEAAAKALTLGPIAGPIAAGIIKALGAVNIAAILAKPLPALAEGGIVPATPGGRVVQVAEGGQDEAIVPLGDGGIGGPTRVTVNLDGRAILDLIQSGLDRRELIVDQGSIA
jgi:hypothetical protein